MTITLDEVNGILNELKVQEEYKPYILSMIKQESNFDPNAISSKGAGGLMQLMPETAKSLGVTDINDPRQNIAGGSKYFAQMMDKFKKPELAVAAYNAGPGAVTKYGGIPPYDETQNYVDKVLSGISRTDSSSATTSQPEKKSLLSSLARLALPAIAGAVIGSKGSLGGLGGGLVGLTQGYGGKLKEDMLKKKLGAEAQQENAKLVWDAQKNAWVREDRAADLDLAKQRLDLDRQRLELDRTKTEKDKENKYDLVFNTLRDTYKDRQFDPAKKEDVNDFMSAISALNELPQKERSKLGQIFGDKKIPDEKTIKDMMKYYNQYIGKTPTGPTGKYKTKSGYEIEIQPGE